jgi:hypothetical protein
MYRVEPRAERRFRRLLESPRRPTWIVAWQHTDSLGLDGDGRTARLLAARYRTVATICNIPVLLRRDVRPRHLAAPRPRCSAGQGSIAYDLPVASGA